MPSPTPGFLFHSDVGVSGCPGCGWRGVPTFLRGKRQHVCPACGIAEVVLAKVGRNEPCPCRSGRKYKRCCQ